MTIGSNCLKEHKPPYDADVVRALKVCSMQLFTKLDGSFISFVCRMLALYSLAKQTWMSLVWEAHQKARNWVQLGIHGT